MPDMRAALGTGTLIDALRWRAAQDGQRHALLIDDERNATMTPAELDGRASAIGTRLQSLGQVGDRAILLCPAGLDYTTGMFGCLYAGLTAVPVYATDVAQQASWLIDVARASGAQIGVTTAQMLPQLSEIPELNDLQWVAADQTPMSLAGAWRPPPVEVDDLAFVLYTSGSTAIPKGVMLSHRNVFGAVEATRGALDRQEDDHLLLWTPPHSVWTIISVLFGLLSMEIPITILPPEAVSQRPARWLEGISRTRATISAAANFLYDVSVRAIAPEARDALDLSQVRLLWNGGESLRADTIARFESYFAPCGLRPGTVVPGYGMTEAPCLARVHAAAGHIACTVDRARLEHGEVVKLPEGSEGGRQLVGVEVPAPGQRIEIVDPRSLRPCAPGHVGEIWTSGPVVVRGYWQQPEETAETFEARLAGSDEGPFLRTGDLGFLDEGRLFVTGRLKEIIIIRGRNLYPADVEASLQDCHPALQSHAAVAFALEIGDEERLAIVQEVDESDARQRADEIVRAMRRVVSERHGVQVHTVVLVSPGTISRPGQWKLGRADCRARLLEGTLPVLVKDILEPASGRRRASYVAPQTSTEQLLVGIWETVLGVSRIGIHDEFADLGGDSLSSMQVLLAIKEAGLPVDVEEFHRHGTIATLAAAINAGGMESTRQVGTTVGSVPLLLNQLALLELGDRADWSVGATILTLKEPVAPSLVGGGVDAAMLERALQHLVFHHDVLRMRCRRTDHGWEAEYAGLTLPGLLTVVDLSTIGSGEQRAAVTREVARLRESLDVEEGRMLGAALIRLPDGPDLVVLATHHIATDAFSSSILVRDLDTLYGQLMRREPVRLPPRTATVREWQERIAEYARSASWRAEEAHWRWVIAQEATALPADNPYQTWIWGEDVKVTVRLGRDHTADLQQLGRRGLSIADGLHYAVSRTLAEQTGTQRVRFLTVSHGRGALLPGIDLSRTVGYLATQYPVVVELEGGADHLEGVRRTQAQLQMVPHRGMGFEILLRCAEDELRDQLGETLGSPIRFNYVGNLDHQDRDLVMFQQALSWNEAPADARPRSAPAPWNNRLGIVSMIKEGELRLRIGYHSGAFQAPTVERFGNRVVEVLRELTACAARSQP